VPDKSPFRGIEIETKELSTPRKGRGTPSSTKSAMRLGRPQPQGEDVITRLEANKEQTCLLGLLAKLSEDRRISI
jgi:hypothetical protein